MKKADFIEELVDIIELEEQDVDFDTEITLDSLTMLSVIAFLDENFSKKASAQELKSVQTIGDIAELAGKEHIS